MKPSTQLPFGEVISAYSRAQAIADGQLIDVSSTAQEAGWKYPVALTQAAWADCVAWADEDNDRHHTYQDEAGRLWDVLSVAALAAQKQPLGHEAIEFSVYRVPRTGRGRLPVLATLKAVVGPGDDLEPVVTIMLPNED